MKIIFMEIWKSVNGYEKLYQVSNMGRVKALEKILKNGRGYATRKEKILTPVKKENDYLFVVLSNESKIKKCLYIHRLVASAFIKNPENKPQVNHISGIKSDNTIGNLEWVTESENLYHSFKLGTHKPTRGTISANAKLDDKKVYEIKERYSLGGVSFRKLADEYGVHHSVINGIIQGKRWPHIKIKIAS